MEDVSDTILPSPESSSSESAFSSDYLGAASNLVELPDDLSNVLHSDLTTDPSTDDPSTEDLALEALRQGMLLVESAHALLERQIDRQIFLAYIKPLRAVGYNPQLPELTIAAPSKFVCGHVEKNYRDRILAALRESGASVSLSLKLVVAALPSSSLASSSLASSHSASSFSTSYLTSAPISCPALSSTSSAEGWEGLDSEKPTQLQARSRGTSPEQKLIAVKKSRVSDIGAIPTRSTIGSSPPVAATFSQRTALHRGPVGGQSRDRSRVDGRAVGHAGVSKQRDINPRYTFDNFVVGNSNQFCHAAARRVAENPGQNYNPLFIYGGVGLGKTHLLHAIANEILRGRPQTNIHYLSSETFTNELIQALRHGTMDEFKNRFRAIEVLLIDDIQFITGKERTQEEFFHTFNALYNAKHQIIITSDKLPQEIPGLEERLQTRFSWGLTADLQTPDFETRVAIIKRKAAADGVELPEQVAHLIADKISSNVRELEGALTRLHAASSLQGATITQEFALLVLKPLISPKVVHLTVDDIKKAVSENFGIKVSDMVSKRRTKNLSFPRHVAMYLCRKHTTLSYPEIGENFGGRDHSSVIHASHVVTTKVAVSGDLRATIQEIERRLLG